MSDEDEDKIQNYIDSKGPRFPILRAQGVLKAFGGRGYPTFVTIGPDGTIEHGDGIPSKSTLAKLGKRSKVLPDLPAEFKGLRKPWQKRDWADAKSQLDQALQREDLAEDDRAILESLSKSIEGRVAAARKSLEALANGPDYYAATQRIEQIAEDFDGLPVAVEATDKLAAMRKDPALKTEIKLGGRLHKILDKFDASKSSERKKLIAALEKFCDKHGDTKAGEVAADKLAALRK